MASGCILTKLFEMQKEFDKLVQGEDLPTVGVYLPEMVAGHKLKNLEWIKALSFALAAECFELIDEIGWKWWKDNKGVYYKLMKPIVDNEIADMWHFLISMTIRAGLSPQDILKEYERKWKVNFLRQENPQLGYLTAEDSEPLLCSECHTEIKTDAPISVGVTKDVICSKCFTELKEVSKL